MSPEIVYTTAVRTHLQYHQLDDHTYAIAPLGANGKFDKECYHIITRNGPVDNEVLTCTCTSATQDLLGLYVLNDTGTCIHRAAIINIWPIPAIVDNPDDEQFPNRTIKLGFYALHDGNTYAVVKKCKKSERCLRCKEQKTKCSHARKLRSIRTDDPDEELESEELFTCISEKTITYPFTAEMHEQFAGFTGVNGFANGFIPIYDPHLVCEHDHKFNEGDPVANKWILFHASRIHDNHHSKEAKMYYRPSLGDCICVQKYEGYNELILNLDNKNLFTYRWMMDILHNVQETRYPLAAAYRSAKRTRSMCGNVATMPTYQLLRRAYNAFIRLLDLDIVQLYTCPICGTCPDTVIMDGIMMGCKTHLLSQFQHSSNSDVVIPEPAKTQRILVNKSVARDGLANYAGLKRGKYCEPSKIPELNIEEFQELLTNLDSWKPLVDLVTEAGPKCPVSHRLLLGELSRASPTSGFIQAPLDTELHEVINTVAGQNTPMTAQHKKILKLKAPLLEPFLAAQDVRLATRSNVVKILLSSIDVVYRTDIPEPAAYSQINEAQYVLEVFPNLPPLRGPAKYAADKYKENSGCRKITKRHARLSPGLFTMFCKHGIAIGFQLMSDTESPKTAFNILVGRFPIIPKIIIYDNACKLHLYAIKREPARFANTRCT